MARSFSVLYEQANQKTMTQDDPKTNPLTTDAPATDPQDQPDIEQMEDDGAPAMIAQGSVDYEYRQRMMEAYAEIPTTWLDRLEAGISRLSVRNGFLQRMCAMIWLPYMYKSGLHVVEQKDDGEVVYLLPFKRFNRNWYNAIAGAALLGNAEVAGGQAIFALCGGDYTVVCKHMEYKFMRPCTGPAIYRIRPRQNLQQMVDQSTEFNVTIDIQVSQAATKQSKREKRVGNCVAEFHVTPKIHWKWKKARAQLKTKSP